MTANGAPVPTVHVTEVVDTPADAAALVASGSPAPLLVIEPLTAFLDARGIGAGAITATRIGDGQSNVTYAIRRGDDRFVVRRGPRPPLPKSTHDMAREARVQWFAAAHGVPVPRILAVCDDPGLLGVPFYVMEHIDGLVITDEIPAALDSLDQRRQTSEQLVDLLVSLHEVPVDGDDAAGLGRPEGYLERQVARFRGLWSGNSERELPVVDELGAWLAEHLPVSERTALIHGDYRLGNVMFRPEAPARARALLDWEMSTLGDPLADAGYLTAMYADASAPPTVMQLTSVTRAPGYLTRDEIVERYAARSGADVSRLAWYETLALWKSAVFCEAIYTRWRHGERPDDDFGPRLKDGVPDLLEAARAAAARLGE
ncbi:phosphotransferase family protein [Herbiconiux daphne]|uniref:Phosphotransferase family protein n=1 Tax=Herbiconiux daphne TaxID=2970914 RepID=A0ABT2H5H8_9MICO|nr:phosphotransferase family protein [Herbiconiux daphne]MCS5735169.1 phosphotransferase family protein [Herbiconiux daphne]